MPARKKRILIIEDERAIAHALELKLSSEGFEVEIAGNGDDGLAAIAARKPDLVLLDLVMPDRDGFSVLEELKKQRAKVPVIVLTNLGLAEDTERAKALGAKDVFIKSNTSLKQVVKMVQSAFK